ncbi:hypothetical protein PC128_g10955 [Phytophthora cactorum]|nr:hypothetical protein PC121_g25084 [Phytophthora cactorum]KAG3191375.1 hypothetical protein PC128_g10955 [Phytophthora cactorum]KAG4035867.1 hypothetical protein PC123_g28565 [Phytophthora cactorum]
MQAVSSHLYNSGDESLGNHKDRAGPSVCDVATVELLPAVVEVGGSAGVALPRLVELGFLREDFSGAATSTPNCLAAVSALSDN